MTQPTTHHERDMMTSTNEIKSVNVHGDKIEINWDGNVWVAPSSGSQHARAKDAMREELERYFSECGEDDAEEEINGYLARM